MAKHAKKRTSATRKSQRAVKSGLPSKRIGEEPVPHGMMGLEMQLLTCSGVDDDLANKWFTAVAMDDLRSSIGFAELLRHAGANPLTLRWNCKVTRLSAPSSAGVVDAYKLAHLCGSKQVFTWLVAWGIDEEAEEAFDALTILSTSFGDGKVSSEAVNFAREIFETLFAPRTGDEARSRLKDMQAGPLGPHVDRIVREACLSLLAEEEEALLRVAINHAVAMPSSGGKLARL